jgi:hypothetical protein
MRTVAQFADWERRLTIGSVRGQCKSAMNPKRKSRSKDSRAALKPRRLPRSSRLVHSALYGGRSKDSSGGASDLM